MFDQNSSIAKRRVDGQKFTANETCQPRMDSFFSEECGPGLAFDLDLVGDDRALLVANRFYSGNGKVSFVQIRQSFFQRIVQVVLQSEFCGRRKNSCVYAVSLAVTILRHEHNLTRTSRNPAR